MMMPNECLQLELFSKPLCYIQLPTWYLHLDTSQALKIYLVSKVNSCLTASFQFLKYLHIFCVSGSSCILHPLSRLIFLLL